MKHTLIITLVFMAAAFLVSCGAESAGEHTHGVKKNTSHTDSIVPEDGLDGLRLDNGRKWKMDDHTRSSFARMETYFLDSDQRSMDGDSLKKAGADLQILTKELIQGCTMNGKAHEQLHVYLSGFMPAVSALSKSGGIEDAGKVKRYLEKYDEYFE